MAGTFSRSFQLVRESWEVLKQDKELVLFPIMSGIGLVALMGLLFIPGYYLTGASSGTIENNPWWYVLFFAFYFVASFIVVFFNTGLIACAQIRLQGGNPTIGDGLRHATQNLGKITGWALINATVGYILRMVRERGGLLGSILAGAIGIAWNLITFFVIPVIIFEGLGVIESIKRSAHIFRSTWGENVALRFSIALFFFLLALIGIVPVAVVAFSGVAFLIVIVSIVVVLYWITLGIIASALNGIFATALYDYAITGQVPSIYSPGLLENAFKQKRTRGVFR